MPTFLEIFNLLKQDTNAANAIAAMASAIAALLALFVSFVSLVVSVAALRHQRRHNVLSVKPFPEVTVADFEDALRVKIRNHGSGPLVLKSLRVKSGPETCRTLIDCLPELPGRHWTNFAGVVDGRSLLPGSEIMLVELVECDGELLFSSSRDLARRALSLLTVQIEYTDAYGSKFKPYTKSLDWFGRHWT
ncbi:hypothetical protein [Pseudoxanthomonas mexicana]|uniref:hypothetical protein n=1 Tax=Pseudoxanthomonas mexicana TaxID=128785 RepID=UPI00289E50E2|nr:hypothetical protein [Pseudoxanthomonas mexicana]